jgi:hypothetical protein
MAKRKGTNNGLHNTTQKTKFRARYLCVCPKPGSEFLTLYSLYTVTS